MADQLPSSKPEIPSVRVRGSLGRKLAWVLGGLVALLILTGVTLHIVASALLNRELDALRAATEPITIVEAYAQRELIPRHQNAAVIVLAVADRIPHGEHVGHIPLIGSTERPAWDQPMPAEMLQDLSAFFDEHRELLDEALHLRDRPRGRYEVDWDPQNPLEVPMHHFTQVRAVTKFLGLYALYLAELGNLSASVEAIQAARNCGASISQEPLLIAYLVCASCDAFAIDTVERILACGQVDDASLQHLALLFDSAVQAELYARAISGERAYTCWMYDVLPMRSWRQRSLGIMLPGLLDLNKVRTIQYTNRLIAAARRPGYEALRESEDVRGWSESWSSIYLLASMEAMGLDRSLELSLRVRASIDCAHAALAVERYRLAHGEWPESLEVLVPEFLPAVPIDPFDGQPIRYRQTDFGCVIYTIGDDATDHGGRINPKEDKDRRDFGFRMLNPELRHNQRP